MTGTRPGAQTRFIVIAACVSALFGVLASLLAVGFIREKELLATAMQESRRASEAAAQARHAANLGYRARDEAEEMVEFLLDELRDELGTIGRSDLLVVAAGKAADYFDHLPPELVTRDSKIKHASVLFTLAQTRQDTGDLDGAITACLRCLELRREVAATDDPDGYQAYRLGRTLGELGHFHKAAGDLQAARRSYESGLEHFRNPPPGADTEGDWKYGMAQSLNGLASIDADYGNDDAALAAHLEAVGHLTEALKARPDEVLWVNQLGLAYNNSGIIHRRARDYGAAATNLLGALEAVRTLVRIEPENRNYEKQLATVLSNLGTLYDRQKDYPRAERFLRESLAVRQGLVSWDSKNTRWLLDLAHGWGYLANFQFDQGQHSAGVNSAREAVRAYSRLFDIESGHASWVRDFERALTNYSERLVEAGMREEALKLVEESAASAELTRSGQPDAEVWDTTLDAFYRIIRQLGGTAASASLIEPRRRTLAGCSRSLDANPRAPETNYRWALACISLGRAFRDAGLPGSALNCLRMGRQVLRDRVPAGYERRDFALDDVERMDVRLAVETGEIDEPTPLIPAGARWLFWDQSDSPGPDWNKLLFDDTDWKEGASPIGYGEADIVTKVSYGGDRNEKNLTVWFRRHFKLDDPTTITHFYIGLRRDDGAVVYVNGKEILRDAMPQGEIPPGTVANVTRDEEEGIYKLFKIDSPSLGLVAGGNVVAVAVYQNEPMSSDLCLDMEIIPNFTPPVAIVDTRELEKLLEDALPDALK